MFRLAVSFLVFLPAAAALAQSLPSGRLVGRVVDAENGAPIVGARITLNRAPATLPPRPALPPQGSATARTAPPDPGMVAALARLTGETNSDGVFEVRDVPSGRWLISARKEGYVIPGPAASLPSVEVAAARSVTAPEIRLDRGGVITGRILDAKGNPMSGVMVVAMQLRRSPNGTVQPSGGSGSVRTNDLGEFRLSGLAPGQHYVVAQQPPRPMLVGMFAGAEPPPSSSTYVATYYPGFTDAAVASPITVVRGGTAGAIDFSLQSVPAYQVSGVTVDAAGRAVAGAIVRLAHRSSPLGGGIQGGPSDANGRFRITNVPAGSYGVMAAVPTVTKNGNSTSATLGFGEAARPGAAPEVTILDDVTNLVVTVSPR